MIYTRSITDLYHGDESPDFALMANNGVTAAILKATQGTGYVDPTFLSRILQARAAGLLTGSYHFADSSNPIQQVGHWFDVATPGSKDLVELDWEDNGAGSASYAQICAMVLEIFKRLGRYPLLYGSNFLREKIPSVGDSILFRCPLSLASYSSKPTLPRGWDRYTLWQYTGDDQGPNQPHTFPGAKGALDVSQFDGTIEALRNQWPF